MIGLLQLTGDRGSHAGPFCCSRTLFTDFLQVLAAQGMRLTLACLNSLAKLFGPALQLLSTPAARICFSRQKRATMHEARASRLLKRTDGEESWNVVLSPHNEFQAAQTDVCMLGSGWRVVAPRSSDFEAASSRLGGSGVSDLASDFALFLNCSRSFCFNSSCCSSLLLHASRVRASKVCEPQSSKAEALVVMLLLQLGASSIRRPL